MATKCSPKDGNSLITLDFVEWDVLKLRYITWEVEQNKNHFYWRGKHLLQASEFYQTSFNDTGLLSQVISEKISCTFSSVMNPFLSPHGRHCCWHVDLTTHIDLQSIRYCSILRGVIWCIIHFISSCNYFLFVVCLVKISMFACITGTSRDPHGFQNDIRLDSLFVMLFRLIIKKTLLAMC